MRSNKHYKAHKSIFKLKKANKIQKSGLYEVWFSMFNDINSRQGFWIRYSLLIPKQPKNEQLKGEAFLWFGYSNVSDSTKNFMIKKRYPIEDVVETTSAHIIKISDAILAIDELRGKFTISNGQSVSWNLTLSDSGEPYIATPLIYKKVGITNTINFATHPNARFDGHVSIDDTTIPIVNTRGLQYHTFGDAYTIPWEWLNAHSFPSHPTAFVDFGYKVNKGVLEYFDGEKRISKWNNNFISKLMMVRRIQRQFSLTSLEFSTKHRDVQIIGRVTAPKDRLLGVEYLGPHGEKFYCYNTSIADLFLEVHSSLSSKEYSLLGSVAFETVYKEPIADIPYLPWESEYL